MESDTWRPTAIMRAAPATRPPDPDLAAAEAAVTAIYQAHALGLIRLAHIMLGDRPSAELWANSSGSKLIVLAHQPGVPAKVPHSTSVAGYGIEFGVLEGNRFTPLPGAPRPGPNPWPVW